jgi:hypothetical protein
MLKYYLMAIEYNDEILKEFEDKCKILFKNYHYVIYTELCKISLDERTELIENKIKSLKNKLNKIKLKNKNTYEVNEITDILGRERF